MIVIQCQGQSVVEPSEVNTRIILGGGLPLDVWIHRTTPCHHCRTTLVGAIERIVGRRQLLERTIRANALVTCLTVRETELQVGEDIQVLDKLLLRCTPCEGTGKEGRPLVFVSKLRGTIRTHTCCKEILVHQGVVDTSQERNQALVTLVTAQGSLVQSQAQVIVLGHILWEVGCQDAGVVPTCILHCETSHCIELMNLSQCIVESQQRLCCQTFPDVGGTACLTIRRRLTFLGMTVIITSTMRVIVRETQVLTELQEWEQFHLQERTAEVIDTIQLILCTVDVLRRIGCQPVEVVHLGGITVWSISRREQQSRTNHTCIVAQGVGEVGLAIRKALVGTYLQPTVDVTRDVGTECIALIARILDGTILLGIVARERVIALVIATTHTDIIVMLESCLEDFILPIGYVKLCGIAIFIVIPTWMRIVLWLTGILTSVIVRMTICIVLIPPCARIRQIGGTRAQVFLVVHHLLILIASVCHRIEHVDLLGDVRETPTAGELHLWFACLASLGSDDNDTIGTTRTIDCCGRGILQDFDVLDVMRVDHAQRITALLTLGSAIAWGRTSIKWDTIHNIQRLGRGRERVGTTYHDTHTTTRSAITLVDLHTCHLSLHTMSQVECATFH